MIRNGDLGKELFEEMKLLFYFSASDLVMKVDALLSAQPKGEARMESLFFEDKHR